MNDFPPLACSSDTDPSPLRGRPPFTRWTRTIRMIPVILFTCSGLQPGSAELPALGNPPWTGYFVVYSSKIYQFGIYASGEFRLSAMAANNEPVMEKLVVPIVVAIEETLPDGKVEIRKVQPGSLQSAQAATERLGKAIITGKVAGDATFECTVEQSRGTILIGGRVLESGTLKNPLRLVIRAAFSSPYPYLKDNQNEKAAEAFKKKTKADGIAFKRLDRKADKLPVDQNVDAASPEVNGPGISEAEVRICSYDDRKFVFVASSNSAITLENQAGQPLSKGFSIKWHPDPAKDPAGSARIAIDVR